MVQGEECKEKFMGVVGFIDQIQQEDLTILEGDQMGKADDSADLEKQK